MPIIDDPPPTFYDCSLETVQIQVCRAMDVPEPPAAIGVVACLVGIVMLHCYRSRLIARRSG